ncbi:MAG TPA: ABC transporter permease [Candidatus Acidoferrales bacterium]|nr:ABC transporter permease [Candidatus Acidoferrales bacterium]
MFWRNMFWRKRKPGDFGDEIQAHLQLEFDRFREQGLREADARLAARRSFGNAARAEEQYYEAGRWSWADILMQNIRFGLRMLVRSPGSSVLAILALALGIGANTAIFSLFNAVLLRNLPVQRPGQLVLFGKGEWVGSQSDLPNRSWQLFSYNGYREFQRKNQVFSDVAAIDSILFSTHGRVAGGANLEKVSAELVSGTYFHTLGVKPVLGRTLSDADDTTPGAHPVAVASYSWWQRRLAADPSAVGTRVTIGATVYTVIGVAPPEFFGVTVGQSPDLWIPLAMEKEVSPGWNGLDNNLFQSLYIFARRKSGISVQQASANTNLLFQQIVLGYAGPHPSPRQLEDIGHAKVELTPAATGLSQLRRQLASPLQILMALVGVVLLIACANVANLLLARATVRQREIAIRMSIGAGRSRLIHQLLMESGLLGLAGAMLGVVLAWGAVRLLAAMVSTGPDPLPVRLAPDAPVLLFALGVTVLTALLFGTVPAFRATRLELAPSLKEGRGITGGPMRNGLARGLIIGQVALSLALLAGAGLFLRSLVNLMNVDTGFDRQNVLVMGVDPIGAGYQSDPRLENMMQRVEERVGAIPGIQAASFAFFVFNGGGWTDPVIVPGRPQSEHDPDVDHNIVGSQYLGAMKMPIVLGRGLNPRDSGASRKVAVINETMARVYFPGGSPVGRTFSIGDSPPWQNIEVAGVVRDAKYMELEERQRPAAFYPHAQHRGYLFTFIARYAGDAKRSMSQIRTAVSEVDPNLPIGDASTLLQVVNASVAKQRLVALLSTLFGILAALLACVGIYGVMSYGIARRTNEFGIRMALGAKRGDVLWMVLRETLGLALIGGAIGIALALTSSRLVKSVLFGLGPSDPIAIGAAAVLMIGVAVLAGWLPARRATRIDPMTALRYE